MQKSSLDSAVREASPLFARSTQAEDQASLSETSLVRVRREILGKILTRLQADAGLGVSPNHQTADDP